MICRAIRYAALPATLLLLGLPHTTNAQKPSVPNTPGKAGQGISPPRTLASFRPVFFPQNATIRSAVPGAMIGYARSGDISKKTNRTSPTVSLVNGGSVDGLLISYNNSTVNISSGRLLGLSALDSSKINIKGGNIHESNGGGIRLLQPLLTAMGHSTVNIRGGNVGVGSMAASVVAYNNSTVNITGGNIGGGVMAYHTGTINIKGGSLGNSKKGGVPSSPFSLTASGSSRINLFGTGLRATLTSRNPRAKNQQYTLSGALSDGSSVNGIRLLVYSSTGAGFTLHNAASAPMRPHAPSH